MHGTQGVPGLGLAAAQRSQWRKVDGCDAQSTTSRCCDPASLIMGHRPPCILTGLPAPTAPPPHSSGSNFYCDMYSYYRIVLFTNFFPPPSSSRQARLLLVQPPNRSPCDRTRWQLLPFTFPAPPLLSPLDPNVGSRVLLMLGITWDCPSTRPPAPPPATLHPLCLSCCLRFRNWLPSGVRGHDGGVPRRRQPRRVEEEGLVLVTEPHWTAAARGRTADRGGVGASRQAHVVEWQERT